MATRSNLAAATVPAGTVSRSESALLWCTDAYLARAKIVCLSGMFKLRAWLFFVADSSDFTLGTAVAFGASIIKKHVMLDHELATVDDASSPDPAGVLQAVRDSRAAWSGLGGVGYGPTDAERQSLRYRRGLYFISDLVAGTQIGTADVRSLRTVADLGPDAISEVTGRFVTDAVRCWDPVALHLVS